MKASRPGTIPGRAKGPASMHQGEMAREENEQETEERKETAALAREE